MTKNLTFVDGGGRRGKGWGGEGKGAGIPSRNFLPLRSLRFSRNIQLHTAHKSLLYLNLSLASYGLFSSFLSIRPFSPPPPSPPSMHLTKTHLTVCSRKDVGGWGIMRIFDLPTSKARYELKVVLTIHCKKRFSIFPSPAGMSLTKLSLPGNN